MLRGPGWGVKFRAPRRLHSVTVESARDAGVAAEASARGVKTGLAVQVEPEVGP